VGDRPRQSALAPGNTLQLSKERLQGTRYLQIDKWLLHAMTMKQFG
jgi:hypothetical protein